MSEETIKDGDVVILKSGGDPKVVEWTDGAQATLRWEANGEIKEKTVSVHILRKYDPEEDGPAEPVFG